MCSLRFENNLLTIEGVRFASISKKTPLSKLSFAFVSLALPLLVDTVAARKKVGAERCEYVFDVHTSRARKRLKVVLLLYHWLANVKTTGGFYCMSFPYFFIDKTAP